MQIKKRPAFLTLYQISLPLAGLVSLAHRATGIVLFLLLPVALYLLQHSLDSAAGFIEVQRWLQGWPWRLLLVLCAWWFAHHLFAGIRFLLMDADIGMGLVHARLGARLVLFAGAAVLLVTAWGGL